MIESSAIVDVESASAMSSIGISDTGLIVVVDGMLRIDY